MKNYWTKLLLPMSVVLFLIGCGGDGENAEGEDIPKMDDTAQINEGATEQTSPQATAEVKDANNETVGTVNFSKNDDQIKIEANMEGLVPGHHGFHIHEKGVCEPDAEDGPFTTAGGHFNPDDKTHPGHAGDMPSLYVNEDGTAEYSATFDRLTMDHLMEQELAVMVHEGPDNFANIHGRYLENGASGPDEDTTKTGDAGSRLACGVIEKVNEDSN
ncbi:superoxide dismutase family protein [Bacillus sp. CECT 9360]|uniref:superoxide dismutase family protein n=1 Tax=Bacillus sp. CECT 9360 TaxID=2845821 RepID=UPI001E3F6149|nr:superoxide dismutase family protein [Bacillus sp. CECT 9360]CAH0345660.1 hypothetical protein BCI9360_01954 [Bacillus sp. CECT 9360]